MHAWNNYFVGLSILLTNLIYYSELVVWYWLFSNLISISSLLRVEPPFLLPRSQIKEAHWSGSWSLWSQGIWSLWRMSLDIQTKSTIIELWGLKSVRAPTDMLLLPWLSKFMDHLRPDCINSESKNPFLRDGASDGHAYTAISWLNLCRYLYE